MAVSMIGPRFYAWDADGKPLAGGLVYTYRARTNQKKVTYTNEDGTFENTNPVVLNSAGYASIYLDGSYKIVVKDASGKEIWTEDPVNSRNTISEWLPPIPATKVDGDTFTVPGNQTELFEVGRALRLKDSIYLYGYVRSAIYQDGLTVVDIDCGESLTYQLVTVEASVISRQSQLYDSSKPSWEPTRAAILARPQIKLGQYIGCFNLAASGDGGGNVFEVVASGTGDPDSGSLLTHPGGLQLKAVFPGGNIFLEQFGGNLADAIAYAKSVGRRVIVRSDTTCNIPSDAAELKDPFDTIELMDGAEMDVHLEAGFAPASGLTLTSGVWNQFSITAADSVVTLDPGMSETLFDFTDCTGPKIKAKFDAAGSACRGGLYLHDNARCFVDENCGVINVQTPGGTGEEGRCLFMEHMSKLTARNGVFTGSSIRNIHITQSEADITSAQAGDCTGPDSAIWISRASRVTMDGINCDNNAFNALTVLRSYVSCVPLSSGGATFTGNGGAGVIVTDCGQFYGGDRNGVANDYSNNTGVAVQVQAGSTAVIDNGDCSGSERGILCEGSFVYAKGVNATNSTGASAVLATESGTIEFTGGDVSGYASQGIESRNGSRINAISAEARQDGSTTAATDLVVSGNGTITANAAAGGVSQPKNTQTTAGLIVG